MRIVKMLLRGLFQLCLLIVLLMTFTQLSITNFYLQSSYGLYERHEEIDFDYHYAVKETVSYLNNQSDDYRFPAFEGGDDQLMSERGISHMVDVKRVINELRVLALGALVLLIGIGFYLHREKILFKTLKYSYLFALVFMLFIGVFSFISFDWLFTKFHELFFDNDLWILEWNDPLLKMVPGPFFKTTAILIVFLTLGILVVVSLISRRKDHA